MERVSEDHTPSSRRLDIINILVVQSKMIFCLLRVCDVISYAITFEMVHQLSVIGMLRKDVKLDPVNNHALGPFLFPRRPNISFIYDLDFVEAG